MEEYYTVKVDLNLAGMEYWNGIEWLPLRPKRWYMRCNITRVIYNYTYKFLHRRRTVLWDIPDDWVKGSEVED